jgi:DNA-binding NtrC family response regulator
MDDKDPFTQIIPSPTATRPLLGLTVLVVEDSRFACEAMRLLCLRSGARIRRADCIRAARRHLQVYRPSAVIIDLGLPDGDGVDLIADLHHAQPRVDALMATSGDSYRAADALAAGADGFLAKPLTSLASFQNSLLSALPEDRRPTGPRAVTDDAVFPDLLAFRDDMAHIADFLEDQRDAQALDYVAQFVSGVARSAEDTKLEAAALALAKKRALGESAGSETAVLAGLLQNRLAQKIAI